VNAAKEASSSTLQQQVLTSGHRRLSRCSESPIEAAEASSSFDTASPGLSSTAAPEDAERTCSSPVSTPLGELESCSVPRSVPLPSLAQRGQPSLLELTPCQEGHVTTSINDSAVELLLSPTPGPAQAHPSNHEDLSVPPMPGSSGRPVRQAASPLPSRMRQPSCLAPSSPSPVRLPASSPNGKACPPNATLLIRLVDNLQCEKSALDARLRQVLADRERVEADNARLRAANLEKDRQLALLLGGLSTNARESIAACSSRLSGLSSLAGASP